MHTHSHHYFLIYYFVYAFPSQNFVLISLMPVPWCKVPVGLTPFPEEYLLWEQCFISSYNLNNVPHHHNIACYIC